MTPVKKAAIEQCKKIINQALNTINPLPIPKSGWLGTVRQALGMNAAQLARRLGVTRAYISKAEKAELSGGISLKTIQKLAAGMHCKVVYFVIPEDSIEKILTDQARKKAKAIVKKSSVQMALENQALSEDMLEKEIMQLQLALLAQPDTKFWDDEV